MRTDKHESIVVSALRMRTGFGKLLRLVEEENRSLVIEKQGAPKAVLLSIRDYVRLAAPESEVPRVIGEESKRKGTDKLTPLERCAEICGGAGVWDEAEGRVWAGTGGLK